MAKNTKKVTVEVEAVAAPKNQPAAVDDWQTQDDAREFMRLGSLMRDKGRMKRAHECLTDGMSVMGSMGRKTNRGRRTAARNIGKR